MRFRLTPSRVALTTVATAAILAMAVVPGRRGVEHGDPATATHRRRCPSRPDPSSTSS